MNTVNGPGKAHADSLVAAGKVNVDGSWSFSAEDGNKLLGANGDDWAEYGRWHLGVDKSATPKTKAYYKYPFGKDGQVYRHALSSAKGYAAQQGDTGIEAACSELLDKIDAKKGMKMAEQHRAWATIDIKSFDAAKRTFKGIASTPNTDRMGDVVEPKGAQFKLPIPFLYQHDKDKPVGQITAAKVTKDGIEVDGYIEQLDGPPTLKERLDVAWAELTSGLVRGLSIGFMDLIVEPIKGTYGFLIKEWEWLELSMVTIPANADASITSIKTCDEAILSRRAALGQNAATESGVVRLNSPGATGTKTAITQSKGKDMTTQETIARFEAKRAATAGAMKTIMDKANEEGTTLDAEAKKTYDDYAAEVREIDEHLVRLRDSEKLMLEKATPVTATTGMETEEGKTRVKHGEGVIRASKDLPEGIGMARYVKALAFAKGNYQQAQEYAKQWESSTPEVMMALKSAVGAGTSSDSVWAGPLVYAQDFPAAFLEYLRPKTIIGRITGLSRVPFNIRYGIQDGGSTVGWVGQGLPKPVTKLHFTSGSLGFAKAAGIVVITQELARFSSPSAELKVRDDLTAQMVQFLDQQFIDPGVAAVANVSPASVTNGAGNIRQAANLWDTMAHVLTDVRVFLGTFASNEISLAGAYWIMTPDTALNLGLLLNTGGTAFAFPDVDVNGGTWLGLPVIVSNSVPHSTSAGSLVALVVPQHVYMADDGAIAIDASTEASLQMDSAPGTQDATSGTGTSLVSMFQTNSIAVRVERVINWSRARSYGVGYIDNVHPITNP